LFDSRFAVWQSVAEFDQEPVEGTVSTTFCCTFGLPISFFVPLNLEVAWDPADGDIEVAELLFRLRYFVVENVN
jgi:hypothetical protein